MSRGLTGGRSLLALFAFVLASCATEPPSPLQLAGIRAEIVAVAPFNFALPLPDKLKNSVEIVSVALVDHLRSSDKEVRAINISVGTTVWQESMAAVSETGGPRNFESAIRVFAQKLQKRMPFDVLIVPSLYIQNAASNSEAARWDGTGQKIEFRGRARKEIEMPPPTTIQAASLLIYVFDNEGNQIHTKRTGLELIQYMVIRIEKQQGYDKRIWTLKDDDPAIESEVRVGAAIAHSLYPFLPK